MSDLQDIKVGDSVFQVGTYGNAKLKVERLTKTMIITTNGSRFYRKNGDGVGNGAYQINYIQPMTPERQEIIDRIVWRKKVEHILKELMILQNNEEVCRDIKKEDQETVVEELIIIKDLLRKHVSS